MPTRKTFLLIMLWSLGAAAVLGAAAILTGEVEQIWRICSTTLVTAAAAALMIPASALMDRPHGRSAGLFALAAILVEFFFAVLLIWELVDLLPFRDPRWRVELTMVFLFFCALPVVLFLVFRHQARARIATTTGIVLTAMVFTLCMISVWGGRRVFATEEWAETGGVLAVFGLLAVLSLIDIDKMTPLWMFWVRVVGIAASAVAFAIAAYAIWMHIHEGSWIFTTIISIAVVIGHANLCLVAPLTDPQKWLRRATIAAAMVTAVFVDVTDAELLDDDLGIRFASAAGFLASCGSLALLVLARMNLRIPDEAPVLDSIHEICVICPGCNKKQTLPVGAAACPTCHIGFKIRLEEPRCPKCDYLLFMLTSDRCPECGWKIEGEFGSVAGAGLDVGVDPIRG